MRLQFKIILLMVQNFYSFRKVYRSHDQGGGSGHLLQPPPSTPTIQFCNGGGGQTVARRGGLRSVVTELS